MLTKTLAGTTVEVNDEGFFVDADQWTEDMAPELAEEIGVPTPLTDQHWVVLKYMRSEYFEKGTGPTVRKLGKASGVTTKELFKLFPKGPAKQAALCAGIPKPRGCI
ncbi:MAG: TusE/DsrC/DsvC family sulfur relay protein [Actinobacteria bacterium]|jgi:TusE/DsrC/DsvC family sulfur relay protein|nr:TusE/DsrC/DsvC family sulfur relay protein [Actinomycetota bacterium]